MFRPTVNLTNKFMNMIADVLETPAFHVPHRSGPGRKTVHTHHRGVGRSKYMPHQGDQECARRRRQMAERRTFAELMADVYGDQIRKHYEDTTIQVLRPGKGGA